MDPQIQGERAATQLEQLEQEVAKVTKQVKKSQSLLGRLVNWVRGGREDSKIADRIAACHEKLSLIRKLQEEKFENLSLLKKIPTKYALDMHKEGLEQSLQVVSTFRRLIHELIEDIKDPSKGIYDELCEFDESSLSAIKYLSKIIKKDEAKIANFYMPHVVLGGEDEVSSAQIWNHRNPELLSWQEKDWKAHSIKERADVHFKARVSQFEADNNRLPTAIENGDLKHAANAEAYNERMKENQKLGMYNPSVIVAEMHRMLKVTDDVPRGITRRHQALNAIMDEVSLFTRPETVSKAEGEVLSQKITQEQKKMLEQDLQSTMKHYLKCYGEDMILNAFIVCRDMARMAIYQTFLDRRILTGSDHGITHFHHNRDESHSIHKGMETSDMPPFGKLMNEVAHYYHAIGYTVGAKSSSAKSDHPYIGAAFIEANMEYFDHYFPPVVPGGSNEDVLPAQFGTDPAIPGEIIKNTILNYADVYFNSDPHDIEKMVKFSATVSEACAVSMHHKAQAIWREHPKTIPELMRLSKFVTIFPAYGGSKKLGNTALLKEPWKVFPLTVDIQGKREDEIRELMKTKENFVDPMDYQTFHLHTSVKQNIMEIFADEREKGAITQAEYAAYDEAISEYLTVVGATIVVGQFGTVVEKVSCEKQADEHTIEKPKYRPVIEMLKGIQFQFVEAAISKDQAAKNIEEVGEKLGALPKDMKKAINETKIDEPAEVITPIAKIKIKMVEGDPLATPSSSARFEADLEGLVEAWVNPALYGELLTLEKEMKKPFVKWEIPVLTALIGQFIPLRKDDNDLMSACGEVLSLIMSQNPPEKQAIVNALWRLRSALPTEEELNFIGIERNKD